MYISGASFQPCIAQRCDYVFASAFLEVQARSAGFLRGLIATILLRCFEALSAAIGLLLIGESHVVMLQRMGYYWYFELARRAQFCKISS